MKTHWSHILIATSLLLSTTACSNMSDRDKSTAIGGSVLTGGSTAGTVGGAVVGGVIGNQIEKDKEKNR